MNCLQYGIRYQYLWKYMLSSEFTVQYPNLLKEICHSLLALEFDVDENVSLNLSYDPTWLAILRATDPLTSVNKS
uniref:Bm717 n=1 Tax=Brugia malayi TaxID=6279 RepID=A0A0J9Y2Z1_BRUMA|nr:Bm717 [Brugia malayi]